MDFLDEAELPQDEPVGELPPQDWMAAPETKAVLAALQAKGAEPRFVGGCVRDALAHRQVTDIDIATPDQPQTVIALLQAAGLRAIPTGIAHGTVTALVGDRSFEITTLRRDIETDGRRAKVEFTDDWIADAARRDFTFNALSCGDDGKIYDPFGGIGDLAEGKVKFVGDAMQRIEEDRLRILRYFRFFAHFGRPPADIPAINACRARAAAVTELSGERVAKELFKLLAAQDPAPALLLMQGAGVLAALLPEIKHLGRLRVLTFLEGRGVVHPRIFIDPLRRLAALVEGDKQAIFAVAARLRLSNADTERLAALAAPEQLPDRLMPPQALRRMIYQTGAEQFRDLTLLSWSAARSKEGYLPAGDTSRWMALLDLSDHWKMPKFPLGGEDVLALGVAPGPEVGRLLAEVEAYWVDEDFRPDRRKLQRKLASLTGPTPADPRPGAARKR
jgi:poly(A) polymerase